MQLAPAESNLRGQKHCRCNISTTAARSASLKLTERSTMHLLAKDFLLAAGCACPFWLTTARQQGHVKACPICAWRGHGSAKQSGNFASLKC